MKITRLHSSRMRTARALTISPSMLCTGGCPLPGGVCSGGVCSWRGLSAPGGCVSSGGVCSWGMSAPGEVCSWGCVCSQGGCLLPGGIPGLGVYLVRYSPCCGQTHACKHITLPQSSFAGGNNLDPKEGRASLAPPRIR